jgi:Cysteine rich repeat
MTHTLRLLAKIVLLPMCISISGAADAQTDMMSVLRERLATGFKKLETACGEDVKKYCSTVTPGEGRLIPCMQAHEDKISDGCASALDEAEYQAEAAADNLREALNACRGDIDKICATTQPGQGRLAACLAANKSSVTKGCADAVQKVKSQ